jgi:hypothetical protein
MEKILVENSTAAAYLAQLRHGTQIADEGVIFSAGFGARLDARGKQATATILSQGSVVGGGNMLEKFRVILPVNSNFDFIIDDSQQITVLPGDAIEVSTSTSNQQLDLSWLWRERALEDSERT